MILFSLLQVWKLQTVTFLWVLLLIVEINTVTEIG